MPADSLTLCLKGVDEISIWRRHLKRNCRYLKKDRETVEFAKVKVNLKTFDKKRAPKEKTSYPFSLQLPQDLPATNVCKSAKIKSLQAKIRYVLIAEITGGAGNLITEHEVVLYRPL